MAETTAAFLTYLGASSATAATASSAISTVGSAVSAIGSVAGPLAGLASAGLSVAGGQAQQAALEVQAQQAALQARAERLRGEQQGNQTRAALLRTLSAQNARYAAAGLTGVGSPEALAAETTAQANRELSVIAGNADLAGLSGELEVADLRARAPSATTRGNIGAAVSIFDAVSDYRRRAPGRT